MMQRYSTTTIPNTAETLYRAFAEAVKPRPILTVTQWADRHRVLTSKSSSEKGSWRTDRTPYLAEVMDSLSVTSPVQRVVLMFASQVGKTEVALNWLGYIIDHAPSPTLAILPTIEVRKRWVRQRLDPMLAATPALSRIIDSRKSREAANSEDMKDFPGGFLVTGGANSPASLASMPIRFVVCDEIDRFPWEVGQEGDPLGLIDERTKTFPRRKVLLVSTPTIKGASRVEAEYLLSDQREYQVPCPHCAEYQVLRWQHPDGSYGLTHSKSTGLTWYTCRHCGTMIEEHHKTAMLAAGRWIAKNPSSKIRGYHLNGLYSPIGLGFSWGELWTKWQEAHGDTANLKRFINTTLGEPWEERGDSIESTGLIARLEQYPETLPVVVRTIGVDVQKDRLELTVVDWGVGEEAWVRDHLILVGDTATDEVWGLLNEELDALKPDSVAVDSGYNATQVYEFCAGRKWCHVIKGQAGTSRPIVEDERRRQQRRRFSRKHKTAIEPIGVDSAKALLYARLKIQNPSAGYIHFPNTPAFDDEYFAQLASEKLVTKIRGTRPLMEWVQTRKRNEALDCLVYALAALRLSNIDPNQRLAGRAAPKTAKPNRPTPIKSSYIQ